MKKRFKSLTLSQLVVAEGKQHNQPSCSEAKEEHDKIKALGGEPKLYREGNVFFALDASSAGPNFKEYLDADSDSEPCDLYN